MDSFELSQFGKAIVRASTYEAKYYQLEQDYNDLQEKYQKLLDASYAHSQEMLGGILTLGLKMAEDKDKAK